jgi:hypothetical protein
VEPGDRPGDEPHAALLAVSVAEVLDAAAAVSSAAALSFR